MNGYGGAGVLASYRMSLLYRWQILIAAQTHTAAPWAAGPTGEITHGRAFSLKIAVRKCSLARVVA